MEELRLFFHLTLIIPEFIFQYLNCFYVRYNRVLRRFTDFPIKIICVIMTTPLCMPPLWNLVKLLIPLFLKKIDCENALSVFSPESLVRTYYDENNAPVTKLYSQKQTGELLRKCKDIKWGLIISQLGS